MIELEDIEKEEFPFIVRNHTKKKGWKVCLPMSEKRAENVKKAKAEFRCVCNYFENKIAGTLVLYGNLNGNYEEIAHCEIVEGEKAIVDFSVLQKGPKEV